MCTKINVGRRPSKPLQLTAIAALFASNPLYEKKQASYDGKKGQVGRLVIRFIVVLFSDEFRGLHSEMNQKKDRAELDKGIGKALEDDFYKSVSLAVLDNTSELHNDVIPPEDGGRYYDLYKYFMIDEFKVSNSLFPSTSIGPGAVTHGTPDSLKKLHGNLVKVRKMMQKNMEKSGTNSSNPMEFTSCAIDMAKLPSSITDLAAFYFLSCATRIKSLRPRLNGIFILRCKVIQCKFPPVKKAKVTTNATGKVSTKAGQSLESSDRWLAKISIGNQARNAEVNITI